jgi:hypothetical protein
MSRIAFLSLMVGCGWNHLPDDDNTELFRSLWDARGVVATGDGLYVPLPYAGAAVLIRNDASWERVEIGEGRVTNLYAAPDGQNVLAFVERYLCDTEDPRQAAQADIPADCPEEDLEVLTEIAVLNGGAVSGTPIEISGAYNQVEFSADGRFAVVYIDFTQGIDINGPLNLTGVVVLNLESGASDLVPVSFASDRVLFVDDESGAAEQAVVVSRNNVSVVDLTVSPPALTVTFPLTLDVDTVVDPVGIELTPDGRYVLLSASGSSDLYVLDLEARSINIVELAGAPAALAVSPADRTVLVYSSLSTVQTMDHELFETETVDVDEAMRKITLLGEDQALLWSDGANRSEKDLYRLDVLTGDIIEYRLQNPAIDLHIAPTGEFAVVLTRAEGSSGGNDVDAVYDRNPGMEIVDLDSDDIVPYILEGAGLGLAFSVSETQLSALVLQENVENLFSIDLYTGQSLEIDTSAPPVAIGALPDGRFFVTHDRALGLVSFITTQGEVVEVGGFASAGILDPIELIEEEGQ